jgi:pSer/pThr/pTyr-binding forkhead associated (FHA) protein
MEDRTMVQSDYPSNYPPGGEATQVYPSPGAPMGMGYGEATQQAITITCPVCATPNGPGVAYCQDCGLMFGSAPAEVEPLPDASQLPRLVDAAAGRELILNPGVNSVGREGTDVLLPDPTVSRRHAQVTVETGQLVVEDLGSTNGTFVGGRPVRPGERATAFDGDAVRFGSINLVLALPGGAARPAEATAPAAPVVAEDRGDPVAQLRLANGTEYQLYAGANTIGRRSSNQIILADAFASGRHAEITCNADGSVILTDLGSTNGTFVNGERLAPNSPVTLTEATPFRFAKSDATVVLLGGPPSEAEATMMAGSLEEEPATQPAE